MQAVHEDKAFAATVERARQAYLNGLKMRFGLPFGPPARESEAEGVLHARHGHRLAIHCFGLITKGLGRRH